MKLFKPALPALAAGLFALACNTATPTNTSTAASPNRAANVSVPPAPAATADELAAARATYDAACVRCHKQNGEGGKVELEEGEKPLDVPNFKEGHALKHNDAEYARQIADGGDGMPAFKKRLTAQQIGDLVRLIRRDFQGAAAAKPAANANAHD